MNHGKNFFLLLGSTLTSEQNLSYILIAIFFYALFFPKYPSRQNPPTVEIPELPDNMDNLLRSVSDSMALRDSPPDTIGLLRKRMDKDRENFVNALKSRGYFKSEVQANLETTTTPTSFGSTSTQDHASPSTHRPLISILPTLTSNNYCARYLNASKTATATRPQ